MSRNKTLHGGWLAPEQCLMARHALGYNLVDFVSQIAGIERDTVNRLETGGGISEANDARLKAWFRAAGVTFVENGVILSNRLWLLTPIDTSHPDWAASTCDEPVIVRAMGARRARQMVTLAFARSTKTIPKGKRAAQNPWRQATRVSAEPIVDNRYPEEGPEAILAPETSATAWRKKESK
jgi:hypothetical protein